VIEALLSFLVSIPIFPRDAWEPSEARIARLEIVARAIAEAARGNRQVAAAVAVQGARESLFGVGWGTCRCEGAECDRGKAHGYWQWQRLPSEPSADWEALCSTEAAPTLRAATRTAQRFRGCVRGDRACLAGAYACLGGVCGTAPDWAGARADAALALSAKLQPVTGRSHPKKKAPTRKKPLAHPE
jgi:hypothetical protein